MASKYVPEYLALLKPDEKVEKIADLIEAVKMASCIGWDGDHFSGCATDHILEKLYAIHPGWRLTNTNNEWLKRNPEKS